MPNRYRHLANASPKAAPGVSSRAGAALMRRCFDLRTSPPLPISIQDTRGSRNAFKSLKTKDRSHFYSRQKRPLKRAEPTMISPENALSNRYTKMIRNARNSMETNERSHF